MKENTVAYLETKQLVYAKVTRFLKSPVRQPMYH